MAGAAPKSSLLTTSWWTLASLVFSCVFTLFSLVRVRGDPATVAYIVSLYLCFVIFNWGAHVLEKLPLHSPERKRFKFPAWLLTTTTNFLIAYGATKSISPSPPALVWGVWAIVGMIAAWMFWLLFFCDEDNGIGAKAKGRDEKPLAVPEI